MPWVTINMMEGHSREQKRQLHRSVMEAVSQSLQLPEEWVKIQLVEMSGENHSIAGEMRESQTSVAKSGNI